jgi:transposase
VSCDDAEWIKRPIAERCPGAIICLDPFHIVKAATDALDQIRRDVWSEARKAGNKQLARELKGARFALWKNPEKLTDRQKLKLASIQKTNQPIYRGYLLSQQLRQVYRADTPNDALALLDAWLAWARRSQLKPFVKLAQRITEQRDRVEAAINNDLSNARVEQINSQIRLITRRGFGYHSPEAVIALAMLSLGGLCPPLPGPVNHPRLCQ